MTDSTRFIGPRGWAVLVLASGAALSAPFLRNPGSPQHPSGADFSKQSWPDVREKSITTAGPIASNLSQQDWAELERLKSTSASAPRKLTGDLPSTTTTSLPSWADRGPRIDQLVNESIRTQPLAPTAPTSTNELHPMRPWMGHGMKAKLEPLPETPTNTNVAADFALKVPDPDARWTAPASAFPGSNALPKDSGAMASNGAYRKFEDHVKQWPDEKLPPSQFAWGSQPSPQSERNGENSNSIWPPVSRPSGFPVVSQTDSASDPASTFAPFPVQSAPQRPNALSNAQSVTPETVSAPMVSSQSGRQAPRINVPTIEAPKPTTNSPRPKHFIQQPSKRA